MWGTLLIFLILLFLSGFFSSAEIAMMSLSDLQVERLVKQQQRNAVTLARLKKDPHKLLETILIGNNLVNIAAAAFATALAIQLFGNTGVGIATGVTTFFVLLFGEIIPKSLAVNHRKAMALTIAPVLYWLQWFLTPVIFVIDLFAGLFTRLFGEAERERVTEEEVRDILQASEQDGHLKKRERKMIQSVLDLDDTSVEEIMTPRLDVFALEMHRRIDEVIDEILETGFSRIPVYDRSQNRVKGVVLVKDLLKALKERKGKLLLKEIMQEVLFIPESKKLDRLLREFQQRKSPFGIVVDEHGLYIGLVTIEDVLEELVGEIYDENDQHEMPVRKLNAKTFLVPAKTLIHDLNKEYSFALPESEEYDTLAGMLLTMLGHIPRKGEEVLVAQWRFTVESVAGNRVRTVRVERRKGE